jgi:NAD-dependent deacetylase
MIVSETEKAVQKVIALFKNSKYGVVLTGAGISTPSGIPDFRSQNTGLWERDDPMEVASLTAFEAHPERFYGWLKPLAKTIMSAKPNAAHRALAKLENAGIIKATITQNIDGLHQKAGAKKVIELHGSALTMTCPSCHRSFQSEMFEEELLNDGAMPKCPECGRILKPDIVLFEEMLPAKAWTEAEAHSMKADLFLVVGSSLEVVPASTLPYLAYRAGAALVINNISPTSLDARARVVIHDDAVTIIPRIAEALL